MDSLLCTVEALKPDVSGVSESWTNNEIPDGELNIEGYDLYRKDRNNGHKGGGVLLYVKSNLKSTMFAPITDFPEQVGLWCKLPTSAVVLETLVLVSRRHEDLKNCLGLERYGLGLE